MDNNQGPLVRDTRQEPTASQFRQSFERRQLQSGFDLGSGDHVLNPGYAPFDDKALKEASVLFGIIDRAEGASVLLTKRTETLSSHKGQVALPGGKIDKSDKSAESAALREAHEEVGIEPEFVTVVGRLGEYKSGSGYRVIPVVGIIDPAFVLNINEFEVSEVFEVPLSFLMNASNHQVGSAVWNEKERFFYKMPYGEGRDTKPIWGLTAGIIRMIYDRVYG
jgi:8-oxo-dGTP pyrophosphatase MutT (NUDIX family)